MINYKKILFVINILFGVMLGDALSVAKADEWPTKIFNPHPLPDDLILPMPCGGSMVFRPVFVPGRERFDDYSFVMGGVDSKQGYKEGPHHETISGSFAASGNLGGQLYYLGKYEVTRGQFVTIKGDCGPAPGADSTLPQTKVTWFDAVAFADIYSRWLIQHAVDKLPQHDGEPGFVRLPTEAEWEYAARGGVSVTEGEFAAPLPPMKGESLGHYAWYSGPESSNNQLQAIGLLAPNSLGLHDMLGNAAELVLDPFRLNRLSRMHGEAGGFVIRGGSYLTKETDLHTSWRNEVPPYVGSEVRQDDTIGFRLAVVSSVLPTVQSLRAARDAWATLARSDEGGNTVVKPLGEVQADPLKEIDTLANALPEPLKGRLKGLRLTVAGDIKAGEDQRDRAVRAVLDNAASLAGDLRDIIQQMLAIENEPSIPNAANLLKPREQRFQEKAAYYRDTLEHLLADYDDTLLKQQADILKQVVGQRQSGRIILVDAVLHDIITYRGAGDLPAIKLGVDLRRERCRSSSLPQLSVACSHYQ
jgi:hypothetical protein